MSPVLLYHPLAAGDLRRLDRTSALRILRAIETRLLPAPDIAGKPLRGKLKNVRALRVGDWRVIYAIRKSEIWVLRIGHRREVYEAHVPKPETDST